MEQGGFFMWRIQLLCFGHSELIWWYTDGRAKKFWYDGNMTEKNSNIIDDDIRRKAWNGVWLYEITPSAQFILWGSTFWYFCISNGPCYDTKPSWKLNMGIWK